jgi:vacuolar-type H+-ATPase subunit F/Vma7
MVYRLAQLGRHVDADADVGVIIVINAASSSHPDPVRAWVRSQALLAILRLTS